LVYVRKGPKKILTSFRSGSPLWIVISRNSDTYLYCPCNTYMVRTVGAFKRHAKKCVGFPDPSLTPTVEPTEHPNKCTVSGCARSYSTRNALAVHVYEFHSNPKVYFKGQSDPTVIERDDERYLHCPCGGYSVLTTAAILRHARDCYGIPGFYTNDSRTRKRNFEAFLGGGNEFGVFQERNDGISMASASTLERTFESLGSWQTFVHPQILPEILPNNTLTQSGFPVLEGGGQQARQEPPITVSDTAMFELLNLKFEN
ncbi:hypothetical protein BCR33DRAFT_834588, partial [Rhizoclosmatium globosum]